MIKDKKTIILLNKSDLENFVSEDNLLHMFSNHDKIKIIKTSTKENEGIDYFIDIIKEMFFHGDLSYSDEIYITNIRHKEAMKNAYDSMMQVQKSIEDNMPEDFYSIDLMSAYASLGEIIGEEIGEDLVNEIFSKFCMGK